MALPGKGLKDVFPFQIHPQATQCSVGRAQPVSRGLRVDQIWIGCKSVWLTKEGLTVTPNYCLASWWMT